MQHTHSYCASDINYLMNKIQAKNEYFTNSAVTKSMNTNNFNRKYATNDAKQLKQIFHGFAKFSPYDCDKPS